MEIKTADLMTPMPVTIKPSCSLLDAAKLMGEKRFSCLIVAEEGKPIGIITERDIVRLLPKIGEQGEVINSVVEDVMTSPVITISEEAPLLDALVLSKTHHIRHLIVTDATDNLRGLITQTDLSKAYFMMMENHRDMLEKAIEIETEDLKQANEELRALSLEDPMLEIGNRRSLNIDFQYTDQFKRKHGHAYATILLDVDFFKAYNDYYGHLKGDELLKSVVGGIKNKIRKQDRLYRYGGEEFVVLMPQATICEAYYLSELIVKAVSELKIMHAKSPFKKVTISAGIAMALPEEADKGWEDVVRDADRHLYEAKRQGRNRVLLSSLSDKLKA